MLLFFKKKQAIIKHSPKNPFTFFGFYDTI